jgi:sulfide:quinone oxidoreductase
LQQDYLQIRVLELAPQAYVSGQLFETDIGILAKQGIRSIVNNRPDGEAPGQPSSAELARAAEEQGVTYLHFPVEPGPIAPDVIDAFARICDELERPVHVFSRSGARSMKLWELAEML